MEQGIFMLCSHLKPVNIFVLPPTWHTALPKAIAPSRSFAIVLFNLHVVAGIFLASSWKPGPGLPPPGRHLNLYPQEPNVRLLSLLLELFQSPGSLYLQHTHKGVYLISKPMSLLFCDKSLFKLYLSLLYVCCRCVSMCVCVCVKTLTHFHHFHQKSSKFLELMTDNSCDRILIRFSLLSLEFQKRLRKQKARQ